MHHGALRDYSGLSSFSCLLLHLFIYGSPSIFSSGARHSVLNSDAFRCSVLVHPNTDNAIRDHTELATWMGRPWPLNVEIMKTGVQKTDV